MSPLSKWKKTGLMIFFIYLLEIFDRGMSWRLRLYLPALEEKRISQWKATFTAGQRFASAISIISPNAPLFAMDQQPAGKRYVNAKCFVKELEGLVAKGWGDGEVVRLTQELCEQVVGSLSYLLGLQAIADDYTTAIDFPRDERRIELFGVVMDAPDLPFPIPIKQYEETPSLASPPGDLAGLVSEVVQRLARLAGRGTGPLEQYVVFLWLEESLAKLFAAGWPFATLVRAVEVSFAHGNPTTTYLLKWAGKLRSGTARLRQGGGLVNTLLGLSPAPTPEAPFDDTKRYYLGWLDACSRRRNPILAHYLAWLFPRQLAIMSENGWSASDLLRLVKEIVADQLTTEYHRIGIGQIEALYGIELEK
jgi:hypothetical protein